METLSDGSRRRIAEALREDVGDGDWTTEWCIEGGLPAEAEIVAKAGGVIAGTAAAAEVFRIQGAEFEALVDDGDEVAAGDTIAKVTGPARAILTAERTALNFLAHLSGVATLTRQYVEAVQGTGARITDTRKTTPLWRELERSATRVGGAVNHRRGLDTMVLIKDNHIAFAGGIEKAVQRVYKENEQGLAIEIETTNLDEVRAALDAGVHRIMLDNMTVEQVREAILLITENAFKPEIEVSGRVTLDNARAVADAGADYISVGSLTHSAPALDVSLRIQR